MPARSISIEGRIKALCTVIEKKQQREALTEAMTANNGDFAAASSKLRTVLPKDSIQKLHIADVVLTAVGDNPEVVGKIIHRPKVKTLRDLANLNIRQLSAIIAPDTKPETQQYKQARNLAVAINRQSFAREPLTVLRRMVSEREIPLANENVRRGLSTFLQQIPDETDIRMTPIHKVLTKDALRDVPENDRTAVMDQAKALWRILAVTPRDAPHVPPILIKNMLTSAFHIGEKTESAFMRICGREMGEETAGQVYTNAINTRLRMEHALTTIHETYRTTGLAAIESSYKSAEGLQWVKDYLSKNNIPLNLDSLFGDMDYCECKDCQSVYSASAYFVELLNFLRNNNLGPDPAAGMDGAPNPNIHPGIAHTPLEKLFLRRPDLGDLELTCENTNTMLPYIDLVNEVMESYVVHRTDYANSKPELTAFNVIDETKEELLAQPQHTDYGAYCILKNDAVYPFTLPFHQPVEAARIFLRYLGTSRHEVLDCFRSAHEVTADERPRAGILFDTCRKPPKIPLQDSQQLPAPQGGITRSGKFDTNLDRFNNEALDRAVEAEFLGLTQEEYIILTKEAFWRKRYFETTRNKTFSPEEYKKNIGVQEPWAYYGYASLKDMQTSDTALSLVKKQFLPRTGIQYSELIDLLKTRFINPLYPRGLALEILENIQGTYRSLQKLVQISLDPEIRFAKLVDFLENNQSWSSVPKVEEAFPDGRNKKENPLIRRWVYCCFEKIGKLIVLESGVAPHLSDAGNLYKPDDLARPVGALHKHGEIVDSKGAVVGKTRLDMTIEWKNDRSLADLFGIKQLLVYVGNEKVGHLLQGGLRKPAVDAIFSWLTPKDTCNLDNVRLIHLDGTPVTEDEFDRMQRFIRLRRKLGWTIDEVDKALDGLGRKSTGAAQPVGGIEKPHVDFADFRSTGAGGLDEYRRCRGVELEDVNSRSDITPDFLHQLTAVKKLVEKTGLPLMKLLSFWTDISTAGEKSLYSRLFLSHNMVGIDDVFTADNNGNYLAGSEKVKDHLPVLMAALKLKADDITAVMGSPDALLTIENVSKIYRHSLLAKILHLRVSDLPDLKEVFGDPFADAHETLKLIETWQKIEDAGFTFRQMTYITKDLDDAKKPLAPSKLTMLKIAKTLYDGLNAIDRDNQDVTDIAQATVEMVREKTGMIFDPAVVEQIVNLLEGTTVYITNAPPDLDINIPDPKPSWADKLRYVDPKDEKGKSLGISSIQVTGILTPDEESKVKGMVPNGNEWSKAVARVRKQAETFFHDVLSEIPLRAATPEDENANRVHPLDGDVHIPLDQLKAGQADPNTASRKRLFLLHYFLPYLRRQLARRFIADTMSVAFGLAKDAANVLLTDVLKTTKNPPRSAVSVLEAIRASHVQNTTGWTGYLIPPTDGDFIFVACAQDPKNPDIRPASLKLTIQEFQNTELQTPIEIEFKNQQPDPTHIWSTDPSVPLKAGTLNRLTVSDRDVSQLMWRTKVAQATHIPTTALLPDVLDDKTGEIADIFKKFKKAALVIDRFNLSADEMWHFQGHGDDFGTDSEKFDFNQPTLGTWERIADFAALRKTLPKAGTPLLDLFQWACNPDDAKKLVPILGAVTQWKEDRIHSLISDAHFDLNVPKAFRNEKNLIKMQKAIAVADKVGVDMDRLFNWALPGSKYWSCHQIAEDIRMAMRGRFDAEGFEKAVKPLSDQLREMQKKALVSYLLVQQHLIDWGVVDADSLFEFFLIDVQMGADRQTSRMVQAIASVQLFIKRCLMGLEERYGLTSDVIDRKRWEWMQKYRIWEANRKVYLYPENWIRPELRDDKSPFYKELESELLQKDINTQNVGDALRTYLYKVDEVSNMRVAGIFLDELNSRLHIFARTHNAPYSFYYRYYDISHDEWYPWERVEVDIPSYDVEETDDFGNNIGKIRKNGAYLIPVVWNKRLMIFFPQILKKTVPDTKSMNPQAPTIPTTSDDAGNVKVPAPAEFWEIKMAWSEYRNGKWTAKQVSKDGLWCRRIRIFFEPTYTNQVDINQFLFVPDVHNDKIFINVEASSNELKIQEKPEPNYISGMKVKFWWRPADIVPGDALDGDSRLNIRVYNTSGQNGELIAQKLSKAGWDHCEPNEESLDVIKNLTMNDIQNGKIALEIYQTTYVLGKLKRDDWKLFCYQICFSFKEGQEYTTPEWKRISLNTEDNSEDEQYWSNLIKIN